MKNALWKKITFIQRNDIMNEIIYSWSYFLFVMFIIIPINIRIIIEGKIWLGIYLIISQFVWYSFFMVKKIKEDED